MGPAFSHSDDLYCLQTRPVVTLPPSCFFDLTVPGTAPTLWDNSNIVESYSGVTSPLTFSFASHAYEQVRREGGRVVVYGRGFIVVLQCTCVCRKGVGTED